MTHLTAIHSVEFDNPLINQLLKYQRRLIRVKTRNELMDTYVPFQKGQLRFYIRMVMYNLNSFGYDYKSKRLEEEYQLIKMLGEHLSNEAYYNELDTHDEINKLIAKVVIAIDDLVNQMNPYVGFTIHLN